MTEKKHCASCRFALKITYGPCPSGPDSGVFCSNRQVAEEQGSIEDFEEQGYSHLFTVESIEGDSGCCSYWKIKVPEGKRIFHLKMKKDRGIEDAIVFAKDMKPIEGVKQTPPQSARIKAFLEDEMGLNKPTIPHYVGFSWDDVEEIVEITQEQLDTLLDSEKAGVADL